MTSYLQDPKTGKMAGSTAGRDNVPATPGQAPATFANNAPAAHIPELADLYDAFVAEHNRPPVIGLDLDGTTADMVANLRGRVAEARGIAADRATLPDPDDYLMWQGSAPWFASKEDFLGHFQAAERDGMYRELGTYEGAVEVLRTLAEHGFVIHAVTARSATYNNDTQAWLDAQGIPAIQIRNPGFDKHTLGDVDVFIDDAPHVIDGLANAGRSVVVFEQPYNADNLPAADHVKTMTRWEVQQVANALRALLNTGHQ
jgi:uncharacterized HAD superfamily protein